MSFAALNDIGRLLIVGMARSGIAASLAACRMLPGTEVVLCDSDPSPAAAAEARGLREAGVRVELGREDNALLDGCGLVVKSPGVPKENSLLLEAHMRGIPVWGEVEFAWRFLGNIIVGVTGTNGKTTTTELLGHVIAGAGRPCRVAGNVGIALSSLVGEVDEDELLLVELSSFQLDDCIDFRPDVAILLNLSEDHLDRHPDAGDYFAAKLRIFENQQPGDVSIINFDNPECRRIDPGRASPVWFSRGVEGAVSGAGGRVSGVAGGAPGVDGAVPGVGKGASSMGMAPEPLVFISSGAIRANLHELEVAGAGLRSRLPGAWRGAANAPDQAGSGRIGDAGGEVSKETGSTGIINWSDAALKGEHNLENCLAATAACLCLGLSPAEVAAGIRSFPGVPHRLQEVRVVDGVTYVNDSKATNVDAALKALTAYGHGVHLILGGRAKGCDFDGLARAVSRADVVEVILIGEAAGEIAASFAKVGIQAVQAGKLDQAVHMARGNAGPGDAVLLSPACASFDQYDNYEQRGTHFVDLVNEIEAGED